MVRAPDAGSGATVVTAPVLWFGAGASFAGWLCPPHASAARTAQAVAARSVPRVLLHVGVRIQGTLRNGEQRSIVAIGRVVEPGLGREHAEADQIRAAVAFDREFPPQLVQEPPVLD